MRIECHGCGSAGAGPKAIGSQCPFCGGIYQIAPLPQSSARTNGAALANLDECRGARRCAHEAFEQYRRAGLSEGISSWDIDAYWKQRTDPEYDRLANRFFHANSCLNAVLNAQGLPSED